MADNKTDRRVRRTKTLLIQGLIQLMETKDVKDISVKELADLADINRGTFYLHYSDVYDMLSQIEDRLFTEFYEIIDRTLTPDSVRSSPRTTLFEIFAFLERHRDITRVMTGPHGDLTFVNRMKNLVKEHLDSIWAEAKASGNNRYAEAFVVSGCVGVFETWLRDPLPPPPETMAQICGRLLEKGILPDD